MTMQTLTAQISGVGKALPERRLTNADLEKMVDTSDEWIAARTGIREQIGRASCRERVYHPV